MLFGLQLRIKKRTGVNDTSQRSSFILGFVIKVSFKTTFWQRKALYGIVLCFCLWGLWDVSDWIARYGQSTPYSFPFQLFTEPWYISGDILVGIAVLCIIGFIFDRKRKGEKS